MLCGLPLTKGDMQFGCGAECPDRVFAFVQCAHALDLDSDRLLQRRPDGTRLSRTSSLAQNAVGALPRIQLDGLQQLLPGSAISFSCLRGHCTGSSPGRIDDPARNRLSWIETMNDNRTGADFVVRRRLRGQ